MNKEEMQLPEQIELFCITQNPEANLVGVILSSYDIELEEVFSSLGKNPETYSKATEIVQMTYKLISGDELSFLTVNLKTLLETLTAKDRSQQWCNSLIKASYSDLPTVMDVIIENHAYDGDFRSTNGNPRTSESSYRSNKGGNGHTSNITAAPNSVVDDHWDYVEKVIISACDGNESFTLAAMEFQYKSSFQHGWKHAIEYLNLK
jgi:hypothetical protein